MEYSFIIAVIPVILVVAFLVWIAKKITDGERLDMKEGVLGVVILMVAVLIMVPMVSSTQVYTWDEDTGELVIQQNISGGSYAWDTYDSQIRSIVIKPGVTQIGNSAFDGATNLESISIPESVTDIGVNAFGVTFKDYLGQTVEPEAGDYAGGNGSLYLCDPSIYTYNSANAITGLTSAAASAVYLVLPNEHSGESVTEIAYSAFANKTSIALVTEMPDCRITTVRGTVFNGCTSLADVKWPASASTVNYQAFNGCTSLEAIDLPSVTVVGQQSFFGCTSLESVQIPSVTTIDQQAFQGCAALADIELPDSLETVNNGAFNSCTSLTSITIPGKLTALPNSMFQNSGLTAIVIPDTIATIGNSTFSGCTNLASVSFGSGLTEITGWAFANCTGTTSVTFADGFSSSLVSDSFRSWTFYASDGTTQIDKTDASALAGKTFQGTAAALVEVTPGLLSLTPQQIQQVHLHDTELQDLKDQISINPLPLQPSLQEQEQTA